MKTLQLSKLQEHTDLHEHVECLFHKLLLWGHSGCPRRHTLQKSQPGEPPRTGTELTAGAQNPHMPSFLRHSGLCGHQLFVYPFLKMGRTGPGACPSRGATCRKQLVSPDISTKQHVHLEARWVAACFSPPLPENRTELPAMHSATTQITTLTCGGGSCFLLLQTPGRARLRSHILQSTTVDPAFQQVLANKSPWAMQSCPPRPCTTDLRSFKDSSEQDSRTAQKLWDSTSPWLVLPLRNE